MTQPNEAVDQQQQPQGDVLDEVKQKVKEYFQTDARERIYKKYDEMTRPRVEPEDVPEAPPATEVQPEATPQAEPASEPASESTPKPEGDGEEILTREEFVERFKRVKVKGKFAGEEAVVPASELVKVTGLEKHWQKRLTEVNQREKELLEKQYQVPDPLMAAVYPQQPQGASPPAPITTALEHLSDDHVRARYNELALESPFDATRFLTQVNEARQQATLRLHRNKAELAQKNFLVTYGLSEDSPEFQRINSREFYEKYPDILRARDRGDYDSMFATAHLYLQREQFEDEKRQLEEKIKVDRAKAEEKKKGQILRAATRPEPVKPKEEKTETPAEYIRKIQAERRGLQRIVLPKKQ